MTRLAVLLFSLMLAACASPPPTAPTVTLLRDELFAPPAQPPLSADEIFAVSEPMKRYVEHDIAAQLRSRGPQKGLLDALYSKRQLRLEYDAERTRTASEAFEARAGNCLSLVIMTAALAKHLGMQVSFNNVYTDDTWTRNQDTYFASGHVNVTLGRRWLDSGARGTQPSWTIDFLPPEDRLGQRSREVGEATIVAMFMNNRAAESLAIGELNEAYAWARAAVLHEPAFLSAYNTLAVVYLRRGHAVEAERALAHVLQHDPQSTIAMSNMVRVQGALGRPEVARGLAARLARIDPEPPFHFFELGQAAMRRGDFVAARQWFAKEVARAPYQHEFHFWLAMADYQLGDIASARQQLDLALSTSTTRRNQQLYAAKLDHLKHLGVQ